MKTDKYGVSRSRDKKGVIVKREFKNYTMCVHASVGGGQRVNVGLDSRSV